MDMITQAIYSIHQHNCSHIYIYTHLHGPVAFLIYYLMCCTYLFISEVVSVNFRMHFFLLVQLFNSSNSILNYFEDTSYPVV